MVNISSTGDVFVQLGGIDQKLVNVHQVDGISSDHRVDAKVDIFSSCCFSSG